MRFNMARYSEEFKSTTVRKALLPDGPGAAAVAEEAGISLQTLYNWLRKMRGEVEMRMGSSDPKNRSMLEKQELLLESASIPTEQLGEWLRKRGIHEEHLKLWRSEIRETLKLRQSEARKELSEERKKVKQLEKELRKKDKALAEVTAIMVLKKKLEGIIFEPDGDR